MNTDNENWRDSYEDNVGASRDGNNSYNRDNNYNRNGNGYYNRERIERPVRPSYNKYGNSEDRPARPRINREGGGDARPRFNNNRTDRPQRSYNNRDNNYNSYGRDNNRGGGYDRPQRSYNNDGENKPWRQNSDQGDRPRFSKPSPNSLGGSYNREGGSYNREGGYNRSGGSSYNRGGSYNREGGSYNREGGSYNRGGGYNREGGYNNNRSPRPRFNSGDNRGQGGYNRPRFRTNDYNPNDKYSQKKQIEYKEQFVDPEAPIRLNKFLANAGICSRREADEFITAGAVSVNGEVVTELGTKIKRADLVKFHDAPVSIERKVYILLNKPKDCVTTLDDPQERRTVMDLIKNSCNERVYPVGRLDRNTTGVLLLTNDGDLASKLTHPQYLKKKIYHVHLDKNLTRADLDKITEGIQLEDGEIKADSIQYVSDVDRSQVGIEIHSGKNRIVRRIFETLGYKVIKLDRVYFAGLTKKRLRRGDWRFLTEQEVNFLRMGSFE